MVHDGELRVVEAVAEQVVGGQHENEVTADLDHLHVARQGSRDIEDVLERAAVKHEVESLVKLLRDRLVQVVDDAGALIIGRIHRVNFLCT